jgi:hypothetical protein
MADMYSKTIIDGVILYRPDINLDLILNEIKDNPDIINSYTKWGDHENYYQADISFEDELDKAGKTKALQEIKKHYEEIFFQYLKDVENLNILPEFLDYTGLVVRWIPLDGGLLQKHGNRDGITEDDFGLGFHLDIATADPSPGYKHIFTIIFYLNDNYEYGEILFTYNDHFNNESFPSKDMKILKYKPKAGDVIVFPAHFPHAASAPSGNDRHVFLSTCKIRVREGEDISNYLPKNPGVFKSINVKNYEITYVNGADL